MDEVTAETHLELARAAAAGDEAFRKEVNTLVHPLIDYHTSILCKRFCGQNRYQFRCTLSQPVGSPPADAAWCEWGNASYGWMLDDLASPARLSKYQAKNGATLFDYLYRIANSLPFYERWKDWRFGRRVLVPSYIQSIDPLAAKVFYALRAGTTLELIAQQLGTAENQVAAISRQIVNSLAQRHRLHLLDNPKSESLTHYSDDDQSSHQHDVPYEDHMAEQDMESARVNQAWGHLDAIEQFVLEALVINEQDAGAVLAALQTMDISIKKGVDASQTNVQQLYYFKRKALHKLAQELQ